MGQMIKIQIKGGPKLYGGGGGAEQCSSPQEFNLSLYLNFSLASKMKIDSIDAKYQTSQDEKFYSAF